MKRGKSEISYDNFFPKNYKGLSTVANVLIIICLTIAIGVVFIIIYNIVSAEIEYSTESNISLEIEKESVVIDENNKVTLTVNRDLGDAELDKIKFVLFDGENIEEIERSAADLDELGEKSFSFTPKLVTNIKTISVVPIIKVGDKRKYLKVANSIQIKEKEDGGISVETPTATCGNTELETGEQCDDGNLISGDGCSMSCKTEITADDTTTGGDTGSTSSNAETPAVPVCGDGSCNGAETYATCPGDCPLCTTGQTQQCGSTDVGACAYGTQTCGANNTWGSCVGSVTAVAEVCNSGLDKDCDGLTDCADSDCNGQTCAVGKICSGGSCVVVLKANGVSCSLPTECSSGFCADGVCCDTACTEACKTCSSGTCSNAAGGSQSADCTGCSYCNGAGACVSCHWSYYALCTGNQATGNPVTCTWQFRDQIAYVNVNAIPSACTTTSYTEVIGGYVTCGLHPEMQPCINAQCSINLCVCD